MIAKLAEHSPKEIYRVLKLKGYFYEFGTGPEANKEIKEFFPERMIDDSFTDDTRNWKRAIYKEVQDAGFKIISVEDFKRNDYQSEEEY